MTSAAIRIREDVSIRPPANDACLAPYARTAMPLSGASEHCGEERKGITDHEASIAAQCTAGGSPRYRGQKLVDRIPIGRETIFPLEHILSFGDDLAAPVMSVPARRKMFTRTVTPSGVNSPARSECVPQLLHQFPDR